MQAIELTYEAIFLGPSLHADEPVLVARMVSKVDPEVLASACRRLQAAFPVWLSGKDALDPEFPVSLAARLSASWALAALNEVRGHLHAAGLVQPVLVASPSPENEARLFLAFHHDGVARYALGLALKALQLAMRDALSGGTELRADLERLWAMCRKFHPDYQARILMQGADALDIPYAPAWGHLRYWQFGWGKRNIVTFESSLRGDSALGSSVARSKVATKIALQSLGVPTPDHCIVSDVADLEKAVQAIGWPCVVKPVNLGGGKGVSAGMMDMPSLVSAFEYARSFAPGPLMLERFVQGQDHRLMVVRGALIAVVQRNPARVVGDGERSVKALVEEQNAERIERGVYRHSYLRPIVLDESSLKYLGTSGLSPASVPEKGQVVVLRGNANLSTGGDSIDVTDRVHPDVRQMAESLALTLGLDSIGLDYLTTDISQSWESAGGSFIEINTTPGIDLLVTSGWHPREIAESILGDGVGRLPSAVMVVPEEKIPQAQSLLMAYSGPAGMGWLCGDRVKLGKLSLAGRIDQHWECVRVLLGQRTLEMLLIVCSPSRIERDGLPLDRIEKSIVFGEGLSAAWQKLLGKKSRSFSRCNCTPDEFAKLFSEELGRFVGGI